jgi:hypothetical protein
MPFVTCALKSGGPRPIDSSYLGNGHMRPTHLARAGGRAPACGQVSNQTLHRRCEFSACTPGAAGRAPHRSGRTPANAPLDGRAGGGSAIMLQVSRVVPVTGTGPLTRSAELRVAIRTLCTTHRRTPTYPWRSHAAACVHA